MTPHPGHALQRILTAYGRDMTLQDYPDLGPRSVWAGLRDVPMAERAIVELATAPTAALDRAALAVADELSARYQEYDAYEHDDLATGALAGYAVGVDAVLRARGHRPSEDYVAGLGLLFTLGESAEEIKARLTAASDDRLRGAADHLACRTDPVTGRSTAGEVIDAGGGDAGQVADLINAEITHRLRAGAAGLETIAVRGRHTPDPSGLRVGDAVRVPTPAPLPRPPRAAAYAGFVVYPLALPAWRLDHRPQYPPPQASGVIIATHPAEGPTPERVTVQVAGHCLATVPVTETEPRSGFAPVDLGDGHRPISDPRHAERLITAIIAWANLDPEVRRGSQNTAVHDRLIEALAAFSGLPVLDVAMRVQQPADDRPLQRFYQRHPHLRDVPGLFPLPPIHVSATTIAGHDHPARLLPSSGGTTTTSTTHQPQPPAGQRKGPAA